MNTLPTARRMTEAREMQRIRRDQIARVRTRIDQAFAGANDPGAYARLIGILKGIMDIISDDGEDERGHCNGWKHPE